MNGLMQSITKPGVVWIYGGLGDTLLIVGIITAAMGLTLGGFAPVYWFLLAFACYLGMIWVVAMRILDRIESKT